MRITEKIYFDTLKLNLKILQVNWNSLEQNPPNKKTITETIKNIDSLISAWDRENQIADNYYQNARKRKGELYAAYK